VPREQYPTQSLIECECRVQTEQGKYPEVKDPDISLEKNGTIHDDSGRIAKTLSIISIPSLNHKKSEWPSLNKEAEYPSPTARSLSTSPHRSLLLEVLRPAIERNPQTQD
jgi:hypothetical protein